MLQDEFEIIRSIQRHLGKPSKRVLLPIGDDAAVCKPPQHNLIATIDTLVEGVHFDLSYMTARELGHKSLAVNLSDIAAMGGKPLYALVSLGLKQDLNDFFIQEFYLGLKSLAKKHGVDVIGGNLVQSPMSLVVDIALLGEGKKYFTRSGAKSGDLIAVTGQLGSSAGGLNLLKRIGRMNLDSKDEELTRAHLMPEPKIEAACALLETGAVTSMIDVSDGLSKELHHLTTQSKVGALIHQDQIPIHPLLAKAGELVAVPHERWVLFGGEDYELLMTLKPALAKKAVASCKKTGVPLTIIGEVKSAKFGVKIQSGKTAAKPLLPLGWNHFVRRGKMKGDPEQ